MTNSEQTTKSITNPLDLHDVLFSVYFLIKCSLHILHVLSIQTDPYQGQPMDVIGMLQREFFSCKTHPTHPPLCGAKQVLHRGIEIVLK